MAVDGRGGERDRSRAMAALGPLAREYPTREAALTARSILLAALRLPKGTVHVISDVHGEYAKLRHVVNNASGSLRPLVEQTFGGRMDEGERAEFLKLLFYPRETLARLAASPATAAARREYAFASLRRLIELVRVLCRRHTLEHARGLFPPEYREVFLELVYGGHSRERGQFTDAIVDALVETTPESRDAGTNDPASRLIRLTVRAVRNLAVDELVIAGDFWDRGPRGDKVVEYVRKLPNVSITWGNHDVAWMGACLGQEACIAHVLRISLRYRRLSQLEEGYGITLQPLERLVRDVYAQDDAASFPVKGDGLRETRLMARMQKAAAILQFKLEGQAIERHPEWELSHRRLLHRLDLAAGTVEIDGVRRTLKDRNFPTIDPADPYRLSADEQTCLDRLKESFLSSAVLWEHTRYLARRGSMWVVRDDHLIFHGCVPVDERGAFLEFPIDGQPLAGLELFEGIERVVLRAVAERRQNDVDLLWYLWCGPKSPLFGKDRIATFENDLVVEPEPKHETKNPYFRLIHEVEFCRGVLEEFGVPPDRGLIVNGHVPVKIENGESPLKRSGMAVTIDGAFSEAYGDRGYTLILEPDRTCLAEHHHFESVDAAVEQGVDIIPKVSELRRWEPPRVVGDTEEGRSLRAACEQLEMLVESYRDNVLREV
jgi:fructose-1,6-bisphosphatase-3